MSDIFKTEPRDLSFKTYIELIGTTVRLNMIFADEMIAEAYFEKLEDEYKSARTITLTLRVPKNGG